MRANYSAALQQRTLDAVSTARPIVEARVETAVDLRQRADQWIAADGWPIANLEVLADGGVRLKATAGAALGPTTVTSAATFYRAFEGGVVAPYIDPISDLGAAASRTLVAIDAQWGTSGKDHQVAYGSVQAWLHPRFDSTKPKYVRTWILTLYRLLRVFIAPFTSTQFQLVPLVSIPVLANTEVAGWVVFPFQDASGKSLPFHPDPYVAPTGSGFPLLSNEYLFMVAGFDSRGNPATNIGWGYDNVNQAFVGGGTHDPVLTGEVLLPHPQSTGAGLAGVVTITGTAGIPAFQVIPQTYAATATIPFKTGSPINLGSVPASAPELVGRAETPLGTSVTFQAAVDPAGAYTTFKDGQATADIGLATQQKYDMQVILTASAAGDLTPIVRGLGARVVTKVDLGDLAEVVSWSEQTDPITHKSEVDECVIRVLHDGERDYRDAISLLLAQNAPAKFYFRVYSGDRALPKDQWLHLNDFFPDDEVLGQGYVDLHCTSCLSLLRQALPVLKSDLVAVPTADSSNVGVWTASTGTVLYPQIADVASDLSSGLPDDTTYIQSVVNPVVADYVATLAAISTPGQAVGATIQFRAATAAGGQSLSLSVFLREGTTVRAHKTVTVNVADTGQGSYTPFQYLLTATEQGSIGNWGNLNFLFRADGTGQIRVGWARLVVLGLRSPLVYPSSATPGNTPQTCMDDLITNQIALDGRYQGPRYTDTSPVLPVAKTIAQQASASTDLTKAKTELDALAWIAGGTFCASQGRVIYKPLYQVTAGTDLITGSTTAVFAALTGPIRATLPPEEIEPISVTAGWRQRVPLFAVPWGWNGQTYAGEAHVINAPALTFYGQALIDPETRCPTETAQWIAGDGLGRALAARHGQSFGLGMMVWRFRTTYAHPELECGDVVVLGTDQFLAYDPIANRALAGRQWVTAVVVGRYDVLGREWAVWVQSLAAIRPVGSAVTPVAYDPRSQVTSITIDADPHGTVTATVQSDADAGSIRFVGRKTGFPSLADVQGTTAITGRNVSGTVIDAALGTALILAPGDYAYVSAVAYTRPSGVVGSEGPLAQARSTRPYPGPITEEGSINIVLNGTFERGAAFWGNPGFAGQYALETVSPYKGAQSMRVIAAGTLGATQEVFQVDDPSLIVDKDATSLLRYYKVPPGTVVVRAAATGKVTNATNHLGTWELVEYNDVKTEIGRKTLLTWTETTFTSKTADVTLDAGTYYVTPGFKIFNSAAGAGSFWVDEVYARILQ